MCFRFRVCLSLALLLLIAPDFAAAQNGGLFYAGIDYPASAAGAPTSSGFYEGGIHPVQVISADVNGDGRLDLVAAGSCVNGLLPGCPASGSVIAVYLGNGDGTFQPPILNGAALPPDLRSIAVGDFNGDKHLDVAAASDTWSGPGSPDLGTITILLGNGTGELTQASQYPLNGNVNYANTLAVGDFNGDGLADVAAGVVCYNIPVNSCFIGSLEVYLSTGSGNLGAPTKYQTAGNSNFPIYPVVADFNGDGRQDLIGVGSAKPGANYDATLTVLLGTGTGSFKASPTITIAATSAVSGAVAADFNHDGKQDLAILNSPGGVNVLFGIGSGTFQAPAQYSIGASSVTTIDLNGDGAPDLLIGVAGDFSGLDENAVVPLINNGLGAFTVGYSYPLGGYGNLSVAAGDFNGDGKADAALMSFCAQTTSFYDACPNGTLSVILGNGDGTLQGAVAAPLANLSSVPHHTILADMNGDGILDLVGTEDLINNQTPAVFVALGAGGGKFSPAVEYPVEIPPVGITVADLNGDGSPDVIIDGDGSSSGAVQTFLGSKDGSLGATNVYPLTGFAYGPPAAGEFTGNKRLGVAVALQTSGNNPQNGVAVLLGNGDGTLQQEKFTATTEIYPNQVAVGDLNKDGKADIAAIGQTVSLGLDSAAAPDSAVTVMLSNGDGTFKVKPDPDNNSAINYLQICSSTDSCVFLASYPTYGLFFNGGYSASSVALADINGDGSPDLVMSNSCRFSDSSCSVGTLTWFYGAGDGTFNDNSPSPLFTDAAYQGVTVHDVNGDGKPDIIASTVTGVAVYLAPFKAGTVYATSGRPGIEIPAIGDINGDGSQDIALSNASTVDLLFNRFAAATAVATTTTVASSSPSAALGAAVTLTATVTATTGTPTGTVNFLDGTTLLGTETLSEGKATFTTSTLAYGTHSITAAYLGTSAFEKSTSAALKQTILGVTTTTLVASPTSAAYGAGVKLTATVTSKQATPSNSEIVKFQKGTTYLGGSTLTSGVGTITTTALPVGTDPVVAIYAGDSKLAGSTSAAVNVTVAKATATVALTSSANPAKSGASVTFTAIVKPEYAGTTPSGTVTFTSTTASGTTTLSTVTLAGGTATYTTTKLPTGTSSIKATYNGSTSFNTASASLSQVVH